MQYEGKGTFAGDGFTPDFAGDYSIEEPGSSVEESDATEGMNESGLWECAPGSPEEWLKEWEGRQKTHEMFHRSYD